MCRRLVRGTAPGGCGSYCAPTPAWRCGAWPRTSTAPACSASPVNQLSLLLWSVGGGLAALTVVLRAPSEGVPLTAAAGPTVLLPALAAAVIVGMGSLWGAFVAGVGIGVLDQVVLWNVDRAAPTSVVLLAVIVVALLVRRRPPSRAELAGDQSWSVVGVGHPLPRAYAALREVRTAKTALGVALAAALVGLPLLGTDSQVNFGRITLTYALVALSLVVLTGWGGVVSLGQVAVMGVGAVVTANLIADHNSDLFVCLGLSAVAGGILALVLGLPALRVSGQFLAVTTLAFAVAMELYVLNPANYPSWLPAAYERPELWGAVGLSDERWLYALALGLVLAGVYVVRNLRGARAGRTISATRDNEWGAAAAGVNTVETRLAAFVFAGVLAGVAGGLHAVALRGIGQSTYPAATSLLVFSMAVIGGVSSLGGAPAGVALVQWLGYLFPRAQLLLTGVGLLLILLVIPGGLAQAFERVRDRFARAMARRHGVELVDHVQTVEENVEPTHAPIYRDATGAGLAIGSVRRERLGADLLQCEGVESAYGSLQVLFGVDLEVERNELLALLGTNGAGKSTLLRSIAGLLPPIGGRVTFDGHDITGLPAEEIARLGLSLTPGGKGVFPTLTVAENLRLATWMQRHDSRAADRARRRDRDVPDPRRARGPARGRPVRRRAAAAVAGHVAGDPASCSASTSCRRAWRRPWSTGWWRRCATSTPPGPRSWSSSSRSTSPCCCATAACSSRRGRYASGGPRPGCSTDRTSCGRSSSAAATARRLPGRRPGTPWRRRGSGEAGA